MSTGIGSQGHLTSGNSDVNITTTVERVVSTIVAARLVVLFHMFNTNTNVKHK